MLKLQRHAEGSCSNNNGIEYFVVEHKKKISSEEHLIY